jgi:uncharacterized membrane protein YhaH (DUF805 family)
MAWINHILFGFQGRINRVTWLGFFVALAVGEALLGAALHRMTGIPAAAAGAPPEEFFNDRAVFVAELIFFWPSVAVDVKRWHDIGRSGWLTLIAYVPAFALFLAGELKGAGLIPQTPLPAPVMSTLGLVFLVYFVLLAARRGACGANRFGEAAS